MYIKTLELTNFQRHSHLLLDFSQGVNTIYGKTDSGKSCIVRAIKWLFFGEPKGDIVRKEGSKKTSVVATLDNDIMLERVKSASTNRYILTVKGETKTFDAIGKEIPQEIKDIIKVMPITVDKDSIILNVADQIALPFLLDKSGLFRMKLFNKLTNGDIIDKSLQSFNKDILRISREGRLEKEHLEEGKNSLKDIEIQKIKVEEKHKKFSKLYTQLKENSNRHQKLFDLYNENITIETNLKEVNSELKNIKLVDEKTIQTLQEKLLQYKVLEKELMSLSCNEAELEIASKKIDEIKIPNISTKDLREKVEKLENLEAYTLTIKDCIKKETDIGKNILNVVMELEASIIEYKELLKKSGICPTCKTKITDNIIKEIKL